jgi:hypothetical protein
MHIKRFMIRSLVMAAATLGIAPMVQAQTTTCGIVGSSTAAPVLYDPFDPVGLQPTTVTLNLTRVNNSGGGDTRIVNFYLKARSNVADGTSIVPIAVTGSVLFEGLNQNIFYDFNAPPPIVSPTSLSPSATQRFLKINFTGNNAGSDVATVTFQVRLPANLDLNTSTSLAFDAFFGCNIQGGQANGREQIGSFNNAVVFPITILSALQASYAGTALDFGEVGDKTTTEVLAAPAAYTTPLTNNVRVRSSGPYSVSLTSDNVYRLTFPGGSLGTSNHVLNYKVRFLGQERSNASPTFNTVTCLRAGVPAGEADVLPVVATLLEGGSGKLVSPNYSDNLTVTVTPLLLGAPSQVDCPSL